MCHFSLLKIGKKRGGDNFLLSCLKKDKQDLRSTTYNNLNKRFFAVIFAKQVGHFLPSFFGNVGSKLVNHFQKKRTPRFPQFKDAPPLTTIIL